MNASEAAKRLRELVGDAPSIENEVQLLADIRTLIAAVPQWQPIETAPKDGTRILAYYVSHQKYSLMRWLHFEWCDDADDACLHFDYWMPLPSPPEKGE